MVPRSPEKNVMSGGFGAFEQGGAKPSAKLVATGCQFHQNGKCGMYMDGLTTIPTLTHCTSHHNNGSGVAACLVLWWILLEKEHPCTTTKHAAVHNVLPWHHHQRLPTLRSQ